MSRITAETRREAREIMGRVVVRAIKIDWRTSERMGGAGDRRSHYRGAGSDYDGAIEYEPGDDIREIDWNHYAASGGQELLVNVYRQVTELKAYVLADVSKSMNFGTARATKRRLAAELAASCVASLDETKDRAGLILYSAKGVEYSLLPARGAASMVQPTVVGILTQEQTDKGNGSGLAKALQHLPQSKSLVFIVSDFMNMTDQDWQVLRKAARRHDVVCLYVQDIRERELPEIPTGHGPLGWFTNKLGYFYTLEDWTGAKRTIWVSKKTRQQYADNFRRHEAAIVARLKEFHCRWLIVSTEEGDSAFPKITKMLGSSR